MYGYRSDEAEIDKAVEGVCLRKGAKNGAWLFTVLAAVLFSVICGTYFGIYGVNTPWSLMVWATIGLCGIAGAVITWLICWPFVGRSMYWQNAVDFIEAIQYVESVTGRQFEDWSTLDDGVETAVEKALVQELETICAIQEKDPIKARDLFAKWRRRHEQMQRLFPSIKGYYELTTPATFLPYDQEADSSVHYCSR